MTGLSSPMMPSSRVLRKRKQEQGTDDAEKNENFQASKRTREDQTVAKQPNEPSAPDQSPAPIRSDIGVITRLRSATSIKKKRVPSFDRSLRPDTSEPDTVVGGTKSLPEIDILRSRIQELEEERNDYHDSLHKETEKAMERGRNLLLLQARAATTKQWEDPTTIIRHPRSLNHKDESPDTIVIPAEATRQHEPPAIQQIPSGESRVLKDVSMSSCSVLERELQKQVEELSKKLSEAESEITQRVSQVLKLFKYKFQDEQFAAQSRLMRTEDCKLAQAVEEPKSRNEVRLLRQTNHHLSEKLRKHFIAGAKLQEEVRELHANLEESVRSRDEVAATLRDASQSHSREKAKLEDQIRGLESDVAQAHLEIGQLKEEKTSLESLECKNKQLQAEKTSLTDDLSELKPQLCAAESKISLLETMVHNLDTRHWRARNKQAEEMNAVEARVKEFSESLTKASTEMAKRDEELATLRAASLGKEWALQKAQEDHESTVEILAAKMCEASKADAEISRLRHFEHAVTEHDRAVKRFEQDREEMVRQQQERLSPLAEARKQLISREEHNKELQRRNEALERRTRESEMTMREDEARITHFLLSIETQIQRQIEEPGGELEASTEISRPDDATLKQLEDHLQKKFDMIEHELQWYRDNRATIYDEYRRLEQWRTEMATNVAARLRMMTGSR